MDMAATVRVIFTDYYETTFNGQPRNILVTHDQYDWMEWFGQHLDIYCRTRREFTDPDDVAVLKYRISRSRPDVTSWVRRVFIGYDAIEEPEVRPYLKPDEYDIELD